MAGEAMVSGAPIFLDPPPARGARAERPHEIGCPPLPTYPKLGVVRISARDYDAAIHGEILNVYEADGTEILGDDGNPRTTELP